MSHAGDMRKVIRRAIHSGWRVEHSRRKQHLRFLSPDGRHIVVCSSTPSDHRSMLNFHADLRRAGLDLTK